MEQKKKKGYGAGIVTGILATVLVSLLLLGGFRVITNTAGSYVSGKVTEKEVSKKLNKLNALIDKYYLYEDEIDTDKLAEGIYSGYTSALGDKYTVYYDEEYDYDFASWIFGDSMLPDYQNGDVALIKACPFDYDGCVYAVDWDGQSYIKKVYKEEKGLRLVSTNEKYSDKFAPFTEEPRIIGKVVASFTPLEK